ncbi:MAG: hypothetical protein DME22_22280 [Verrucomicrobia bacterium]|nr:MAG: hypothetical protein DME22_22280 [Verrucomicrobiota bacterium]
MRRWRRRCKTSPPKRQPSRGNQKMNELNSNAPRKRVLKRRLVILSLVLLAVVGLVVWLTGGFNHEPLHKGKPISYWVDRACTYDGTGEDGTDATERCREVKTIGPTAVPYLVARLRTSNWWGSKWLWLRARLPAGIQQSFSDTRSADEIRYGAARTLSLFGADAKPAVPDLARLLPRIPHPVIDALAAIGPGAREALPVLHATLTNQDVSLRVEVATALWHIGRETNLVLRIGTNALVPGTSDGAAMNASYLLSLLRSAAAPAVPFALNVLRDTNRSPDTRANAASVLGAARVSSPEIRAALLDGTRVEQPEILRSNCAMALWRLDSEFAPFATRVVLEHSIALKRQFPQSEQDFTAWLETRDLDPNESIPTLKRLLESDSSDMRKEAGSALERIEAKSKEGTNQ